MNSTQRCFYILLLIAVLCLTNISGATGPCTTDGPLLTGDDGKPIWLDTNTLLKKATRCVAPKMPTLARQARIEGQVLIDILVDAKGKVVCVQVIIGHPMLIGSAVDAAKDWTFQPKMQNGKDVSFYGHLQFHFSTGETGKGENSCTVAHW
jgi:TonB family protein